MFETIPECLHTFSASTVLIIDLYTIQCCWTANSQAAVGSYNFGTDPVTPLIERLQPAGGTIGDIDGDGVVGFGDLVRLLSGWGPCV